MEAIAPALPTGIESVFGKDAPHHSRVPINIAGTDGQVTITRRWQFTAEERAAIANGADLYMTLPWERFVPNEVLTVGQAAPEGN
jgi:hypothetical protein